MINKILLENISIYAYHGCMNEEALIGSYYRVDVEADMDFSGACQEDDIKHTVSYADIHDIVTKEMAIRHKLIEHLAYHIHKRIKSAFPQISKLTLKIAKLNPPMDGSVSSAAVVVGD